MTRGLLKWIALLFYHPRSNNFSDELLSPSSICGRLSGFEKNGCSPTPATDCSLLDLLEVIVLPVQHHQRQKDCSLSSAPRCFHLIRPASEMKERQRVSHAEINLRPSFFRVNQRKSGCLPSPAASCSLSSACGREKTRKQH